MPRLVLVRHGRPQMAAGLAPAAWALAQESRDDIERLSLRLQALNHPVVVASTERKAIETAEAIGLAPVLSTSDFEEVQKPWYDDPSDHRAAIVKYFAGEPLAGWEPVEDAANRFRTGVARIDGSRDVVVVTHGTVMSVWLGATGVVREVFEFWNALGMPDAWEVDVDARELWRLGP